MRERASFVVKVVERTARVVVVVGDKITSYIQKEKEKSIN